MTPAIPPPRTPEEWLSAIIIFMRATRHLTLICADHPKLFDDSTEHEGADRRDARISYALDRCLDCPAYLQCVDLYTANEELPMRSKIYGVLAGHWVPDVRTTSRQYLPTHNL